MTTPAYFTRYPTIRFDRDAQGILTMALHRDGGPLTFTAADHEAFVDAFYEVSRDRANSVVILTGAGGDFIPGIDFSSFGDVSDPDVWSKVHDEGTQILENIANIRVPMIFALEGRAHVHAEYGLLANLIVAGEGASFNDLPHFAGGIVPGDGVYTLWSHLVGPGRAQAMMLEPKELSASAAQVLGVVAEVVADGTALARAKEIARGWLMRRELKGEGVHVMTVYPGATETRMMSTSRADASMGFQLQPVAEVVASIVEGMEADAFEVVRGGETRRAMLAQNRDDPAAVDARFLALKPQLEAAVRDHSAL